MTGPAPILTIDAAPLALLRTQEIPHPERRLRRGEIVKVRRGVYADADAWDSLAPWDRYRARVHAFALVRPASIFSHESAAALVGMPIFGDPRTIHVLDVGRSASREYSGARFHAASSERELVDAGGIAVTAPGETAVDLARERHPAIGIAMADSALRLDSCLSVAALMGTNEARSSSRGRNVARWPLGRATTAAETPLESVSRAVIEWLGFPAPRLQVEFPAGADAVDRVDFCWPLVGVAGEADGDLKYDGRFGTAGDALRARRDRDLRLTRRVRAVAHWSWTDATRVDPLRGILKGVGLRPNAPEQTASLLSLRRLLGPRHPS